MLSFEAKATNKYPGKADEHVTPISADESEIPLVKLHIPNPRCAERNENGGNQSPPRKLVLNYVHTLEAAQHIRSATGASRR
jgi:hypothetical protein